MMHLLQFTLFMLLCSSLNTIAMAGTGDDRSGKMSLADVVQAVLDDHPDLSLSRTDTSLAEADRGRIRGLLNANINGSISGSTTQTPVSSDFQARETRSASLAAGISLPLANGDTLGVQTSYQRTGQNFTSPFAASLARFNPDYRAQIDLTYRHALLRGADRPEYHMGLTSVDEKTAAARLNERMIARTLGLSALNAFFRLSSDDINTAIAKEAVARARQLLRYQKSRQAFGLIEQAEALQAEALLAVRRTDLQRAIAQRRSDESALNRLMRIKPDSQIQLDAAPTLNKSTVPDFDAAEQQAIRSRPDLQAVDAQIKAAVADLAVARDADRMQLDVVALLGSRSLNSNAGPAAASGLSVNDRVATLSLEMQDTLVRSSAKSAIRKAELARQRLTQQRRQTLERIRDDLAAAIAAIETGIPSLRMSNRQAVAEQKKYQAELKRYREGRSDTATLVQFEGELRNARLQARLQALTLQLARYQLVWSEGRLLTRLGIDLPETERP
ncbi:MAG: TolC family protein [Mariprofundaceae bacterium]|nr:TolC family protein [Mariprofundaceae bacterium]